MKQRHIASIAAASLCCVGCNTDISNETEKTNFIVIFCDDMGYGDLGCYGNPTIKTPRLDQMAAEGQKWSDFNVAASVSSPSRAALLTGRIGPRTGMYGTKGRVLHPYHTGGMPDKEHTLGEYLQQTGYTTACVGKWHLGHHEGQLPLDHGFDRFYGIPYSNDMSQREKLKEGYKAYPFELPLYNQKEVIEYEPIQDTFTKDFTQYSLDFIEENSKEPFFLYLAYTMPHYPLYASDEFKGRSQAGIYGDVVEEIDYSVGLILDQLKELGIDDNTLVVFTSDNGPWLSKGVEAGSSGRFRRGKSSQFEGGFRVPCIFSGAGVKRGHVTQMGNALDILPTICSMAGIPLLEDRVYDGYDLSGLLFGTESKSPREMMYYYIASNMHAVRKGEYKLHFQNLPIFGQAPIEESIPLLYNLNTDPGELYNIAAENPQIVDELLHAAKDFESSYTKAPAQFDPRIEAKIVKK